MAEIMASDLASVLPPDCLVPEHDYPQYAVDGMQPAAVVVPETREQVGSVLKWAAGSRVAVFPRGGGTKTALGNLPGVSGLVMDLSRLNRILDYQPEDLTVTVEAGVTLFDLQQELASVGQFVPLESPMTDRATVGGILATACTGPMAHSFGPPRDSLIGIGVVGADGEPSKAGGRVVKNVTGYDLNRLYTGSLGTLGVIVEASFKVSPIQPVSTVMVTSFNDVNAATAAGWEALKLPAGPQAYLATSGGLATSLLREVVAMSPSSPGETTPGALGLSFLAGRSASVQRRIADTEAALRVRGSTGTLESSNEAELRQGLADAGWQADPATTLAMRLVVRRDGVAGLVRACQAVTIRGVSPEIIADPGYGSVRLLYSAEGDDEDVRDAVKSVRGVAAGYDAHAVVELCRPSAKRGLDVWGEQPGSMDVMRQIKGQFDPQGILNPGRFLRRI